MSDYSNRIKLLKALQLVFIAACILLFSGYIYLVTRPTITAYAIKDECGPIGGTISHPIDDEDSCKNICAAQCVASEKEFSSAQFSLAVLGCNECQCFCKG